MSTYVRTLKEKTTDDTVYPVTKAGAVYMEDEESTVEDEIGALEDDISTLNSYVSGLLLNEDKSGTANIPASSQEDFTISISKTGYTPVGIMSISKSGGNSGNAVVGGFRFDSSNAVISMRNISTSALSSITISVKVLYIINT